MGDLQIRLAVSEDAGALCDLLNEVIEIGGTTAIEASLSKQEFLDYFLSGEGYVCCFVATDSEGHIKGFQSLEIWGDLPKDCANIATFARAGFKGRGVGQALFEKTRQFAKSKGLTNLNATIRADNISGIAYYTKIGFKDHSVEKGIPLADGTPVDRVSKRFYLD